MAASLGFPLYNITSSANRDSLLLPSQFGCFISFPCLIALAGASMAVLSKSGESGHLCLIPDLRGKAFSFLPFHVMEGSYHEWMSDFIRCFFSIYWDDHMIFIHYFVNVVYHTYWFAYIYFTFLGPHWWHMGFPGLGGPIGAIAAPPTPQPQQQGIWAVSSTYTTTHAGSLTHWARPGIELSSARMLVRFVNCWAMMGTPAYVEQTLYSGINLTWSWCVILLICCWIWFTSILRIFACMFNRDIGLSFFFFFVVSLSGFGNQVMLAL